MRCEMVALFQKWKIWLPFLLFGLGGLTACSPSYQLSEMSPSAGGGVDIPKLGSSFLGIYGTRPGRKKILLAALSLYGMTQWSDVKIVDCKTSDNAQCVPSPGPASSSDPQPTAIEGSSGKSSTGKSTSGQASTGKNPTTSQGSNGQSTTLIPKPVAAIINAAVDECVFWTYQEDTTSLSLSTLSLLAGVGVLGAGILGAVEGWSSVTNAVLSTSGAGIALIGNLGKSVPSQVQASFYNVVQAGLQYYPLIVAKTAAFNGQLPPDQIVPTLRV